MTPSSRPAAQAQARDSPHCLRRFRVQATTRLMASSCVQATAAGENQIRVISQLVMVWKAGAMSE